MRSLMKMNAVLAFGICAVAAFGAGPKTKSAQNDPNSIVIVFKDGHQQTFSVNDIARIEFPSAAAENSSSVAGQGRFLGKWKVGEGNGSDFYITLEKNGQATKSLGSTHGTWIVTDGEVHIRWDDGWHDAIRRAGNKYEKVAYAPGKTFTDAADNITDAKRVDAEPI